MRPEMRILVLACALAACSSKDGNTKMVVVVGSDFEVPGKMNKVHVDITGPTKQRTLDFPLTGGSGSLPIQFELVPPDNQGISFGVKATALLDSQPLVSQEASLAFVPGSTRVLALFLGQDCVGVPVDPDHTCSAGRGDQPIAVNSASLPVYDPNHLPLSPDGGSRRTPDSDVAGPPLDSSIGDAPFVVDAARPDAGFDRPVATTGLDGAPDNSVTTPIDTPAADGLGGMGGVIATGGKDDAGGAGGTGGTAVVGGAVGGVGAAGAGGTGGIGTAGGTGGIGTAGGTGGTGTAGGTGGIGTAGGTGGIGTTGGMGGTSTGGAGSSGTTVPDCLGNPLPMPEGGFVMPNSNGCNMTGAWYWFKDLPVGSLETTVTAPANTLTTPVVASGGRACIRGNTVVDPTYLAWGAGIGFDFNNPMGGAAKQSFDAKAHGIGGFEITVTGSFPQGLSVQFAPTVMASNQANPFVPVTHPGTYRVRLADAFVPMQWTSVNAGSGVDPTQVGSLQVTVVGGALSSAFDFCIESVIPLPIVDDGSLGTKPVTFAPLPLDATGSVLASSNPAGIQGVYYCVSPAGATSSCASSGSTVPYRSNVNGSASGGMCVSGMTTTSTDNWGGIVGLALNQSPAGARLPYNGGAHKLRGFRVDASNTTTGLPLRMQIVNVTPTPTDVFPSMEFAQPGQHLVELGSLSCPDWPGHTCMDLEASQLIALEVQMASLQTTKAFDICVMKVEAMFERVPGL
jgi:hypothetical protein